MSAIAPPSPIYLRQQAERCRRLAADCGDEKTSHALRLLAEDFTRRAEAFEAEATARGASATPA